MRAMSKEERIESLEHTNKIQAGVLQQRQERIDQLELDNKKMEVELYMARQKHKELLREFRAFKSLIRALGTTGFEIEWQNEI